MSGAAAGVSPDERGRLRVGRLTKPHGLKGALKIELFTDNPKARFAAGAVFSLQVPEDSPWFGKTLTIRELKWYNGNPVAFFEELPDRTAAESIVRAILWIDEDTVAASVEENAWYNHQLAGLDVFRDGERIGSVKEVQHLPSQDLLIVATPAGDVMVPFVSALVPEVDIEANRIVVTPPPGLFEELPEEDAPEAPTDDDAVEEPLGED